MGAFRDWFDHLDFGRWSDPEYDLESTQKPNDDTKGLTGSFDVTVREAKDEKPKDDFAKPSMNVISKDEFEARVTAVFESYYNVLAKSYGPFGSTTIICKYPYNHTTKDGFTIAKSMSLDVSQGYTDQAIADMATDICGRINTAVGDGTTTAIICTNNIYQSYIHKKDRLASLGVAPRDVLSEFNRLKTLIRQNLQELSRDIDVDLTTEEDVDWETEAEEVEHKHQYMVDNIRRVVDISSNGDQSIVENITRLYDEMGYPSISCEKSPNGEEKVTVVSGYRSHMYLCDNIYVNSDGDTAKYYDADILIFECQISEDIYTNIIEPSISLSEAADRHLIIVAPSYDNIVMDRMIAPKITNEFNKKKDITLVLTIAKMTQPYQKKELSDLAMLCHTTVLTRAFCTRLIAELKKMEGNPDYDWAGYPIYKFIGVVRSWVPDIQYPYLNLTSNTYQTTSFNPDELAEKLGKYIYIPGVFDDKDGLHFELGYARGIELGSKTSIMKEFFYDDSMYKLHMKEAEDDLKEVTDKYKKLGTFNVETTRARERLYSLKRQLAIIEVGGDSELSMGLRKDVYDDAIKAADSAYKYGTVLGCNVCTITAIDDLIDEYTKNIISDDTELDQQSQLELLLLSIIRDGFIETYRTILLNWMPDEVLISSARISDRNDKNFVTEDFLSKLDSLCKKRLHKSYAEVFVDAEDCLSSRDVVEYLIFDIMDRESDSMTPDEKHRMSMDITFYDLLIAQSLDHDNKSIQVFDVINKEFTTMIINSTQTDDEILNAVIDLLSLLISGNQMIVTQKRTFDEQ